MSNRIPFSPSGARLPNGISLKHQHLAEVLREKPEVGFLEVHAENFMSPGGAHHRYLEAISELYPISVHGVGMSLGSAEGVDKQHLKRFADVVERYKPWLVSEHLAWSREGGHYLNDLLPLPLNAESLKVVGDNISAVQDKIGRKILVENPSAYMEFTSTDIPEPTFLAELVERTGCGILLDVNNVFVSGTNMGWSVEGYLADISASMVGEIHLAGHSIRQIDDNTIIRIDDHGSYVCDDVWALYEALIRRVGVCPTLVEWDTNVPALPELVAEAEKTADIMQQAMVTVEQKNA